MELREFFYVSFTLAFGIFTVASAPAEEVTAAGTPSPARHIRTKRCSCATFLDKECVYFCHLDIIWVNTPERTVSYGLGNAPRKRRSLINSLDSAQTFRCTCTDHKDSACTNFCEIEKTRYQTASDMMIPYADGDAGVKTQRQHKLTAKTMGIKRMNKVFRSLLKATQSSRLLLERWRTRQRLHQRAWRSKSSAP